MKQVLKYQLYCLASKNTKIIICCAVILVLISNIIIAVNMDSYIDLNLYQTTCLLINKTVLTLLSIIIWGSVVTPKNSQAIVLMLNWLKNRSIYLLSQIFILLLTTIFLAFTFFFIQNLVGIFIFINYYIQVDIWKIWLFNLLCGVIYGFYSLLLGQLWANTIFVLLPIVIFTITQNLSFDGVIDNIINLLFINSVSTKAIFFLLYIWYIIVLIIFNILLFNYRDLTFD